MILNGCLTFGFEAKGHEEGLEFVRKMSASLLKRSEITWATGTASPAPEPTPEPTPTEPEALFDE